METESFPFDQGITRNRWPGAMTDAWGPLTLGSQFGVPSWAPTQL